ncbi:MAG TPA: EAL domain-containing protein [Solirubrobacteraceae bacterium]|jgi:diguanylate cyclase (GGDEF)-like protein|nr:EAL domain-containing protein [Solirubrobacteraceae bacterium]
MPGPDPEEAARLDDEVRLLGATLNERAGRVLELVVARTQEAHGELERPVDERLERICKIATVTVAEWLSGGKPEDGFEAANEAFELFGQLAAHRAAPLDEVTKRCLRWRDGVRDVLREASNELGISERARRRAVTMTQATLDVTLVRMCEVFESERIRMDEELASRGEQLAFMATHDQLTGLPNRTLILDRIEQMLGRARRNQIPVAALHVNLDNFTAVNDSLGHGAGDELLRAIAARLDGLVRDSDALGRLGGDEFIVIAEEASAESGAELIAERLQEALKTPFTVAGNELTITASIGVATGLRPHAEDLLGDAEIAAHRAKLEGKDSCVIFQSGMQDVVQRQVALEKDLRFAIDADEFFLVYQPTLDLRWMVPTGVEALIRWRSPSRGLVQPNDFIPVLEETGMIVTVGKWVLEQACRQGAAWREVGHPISVAVNVSARQLDSDEFIGVVESTLAATGLDPRALTLEITETALMRNADETARRLRAIKQLGVRIAIDDFGTGYSSLSHLQRFPVDALKIDRSFLSQLAENPEGETLIRTLVQLGKALSIETLAEGIERRGELALLQEENCDSGQGYLFARPLDVEDAAEFLRSWRAEDVGLSRQATPSAP